MTTFFWSDLHLNHQGIIRHCNRGFPSVRAMNDALTAAWNDRVGVRDTVWVLGDFAFAPGPDGDDVEGLFHRLAGRKCLVVGNHDERNQKTMRLPWERMERLFTFKESSRRAELCHYPLETWKASASGALMLHGHSHGTLRRKIPKRFDVGVDVFPAPVAWEELLALADAQRFEAQDHHGATPAVAPPSRAETSCAGTGTPAPPRAST